MLQGKPAGESEQTTMNAIRTILSDTDTPAPRGRARRAKRGTHLSDQDITTQPVVEVETKVAAARFTTVPTPEENSSKLAGPAKPSHKTLPSLADPSDASDAGQAPAPRRSHKAVVPSPLAVAKKIFRLPRLPKIDAAKVKAPVMRRAKTVKPTPRPFLGKHHIVMLAVIVLMAFRPGLVFSVAAIWFLGMALLFVVAGPTRVWKAVGWTVNSYGKFNKPHADAILDWLDDVAVRWDAVLDRFPDGLVDGLYMPDFANLEELSAAHDAVLEDRLKRLHSDA